MQLVACAGEGELEVQALQEQEPEAALVQQEEALVEALVEQEAGPVVSQQAPVVEWSALEALAHRHLLGLARERMGAALERMGEVLGARGEGLRRQTRDWVHLSGTWTWWTTQGAQICQR